MLKKYLQILLLFILTNGYAQSEYLNGFIVINSGDTLIGEILNQTNSQLAKACHFRYEGTIFHYTPNDIKSYGITQSNRLFQSFTLNLDDNEQSVFLEYLVDGISDLFYVNLENVEYYFLLHQEELLKLEVREKVVKEEKSTFQIKTDLYKGMLIYAFGNMIPIDEINRTEFNFKSLTRLTAKYHATVCDWDCQVFRRSTKTNISIIPYTNISRMSWTVREAPEKYHYRNISGGALLKISWYKSDFMHVVTGIGYTSLVHDNSFTNKITNYRPSYDTFHLSQKTLIVPVFVEFDFLQFQRVKLYVLGGFRGYFDLDNHFSKYNMNETESGHFRNRSFMLGRVISIGTSIACSHSVRLNFQPTMESKKVLAQNATNFYDWMKFGMVGLTVGIEFKLP